MIGKFIVLSALAVFAANAQCYSSAIGYPSACLPTYSAAVCSPSIYPTCSGIYPSAAYPITACGSYLPAVPSCGLPAYGYPYSVGCSSLYPSPCIGSCTGLACC